MLSVPAGTEREYVPSGCVYTMTPLPLSCTAAPPIAIPVEDSLTVPVTVTAATRAASIAATFEKPLQFGTSSAARMIA